MNSINYKQVAIVSKILLIMQIIYVDASAYLIRNQQKREKTHHSKPNFSSGEGRISQ